MKYMRTFLLLFCCTWLTGIALGVFSAGFSILIVTAAAAALLMVRMNQSWPACVAVISLLLLGFVLGNGAIASPLGACRVTSPLTAHIIAITKIEEKRMVYRATASGCQILIAAERFPEYAVGSDIQVNGQIQTVEEISLKQANYGKYLVGQGVQAVVSYPKIEFGKPALRSASIVARMQQQVNLIFPEPDASFVSAIFFAQQGTLPKAIIAQFQHTGVSHILAISGQNISLLAGVLYVLMLLLPIGPWTRTILISIVLWTYIVFIGAPVSAVRAAFFWTMVLLAFRLQLLVSLTTVIILTSVIMATYSPLVLSDIGFQLSLGAVIGIAAVLFLFPVQGKSSSDLMKGSLLVTLGATVATAPIIAANFGNLSLSSLLANLLVVPIASLLQIIALPTILVSFILLPAALVGSYVVHLAWLWMDWVTRLLSALPFSFFENITPPLWLIAVYYGVLVLACILILKRQRRSWREVWE